MSAILDCQEILFTKIAEVVSRTADIPIEKVTPESTFQSLGLDSLDSLALLNDLEDEFKVKIPNEELLKIRTVSQVVETLHKRMG